MLYFIVLMLRKNKHSSKPYLSGFTIVELLIVIVIIAILATLMFVTYSTMNARATQSALRQGLSDTAKRIELDKVTRGQYSSNLNDLANSTAGSNNGIEYQYTSSGDSYCLTGTLRGTAFNVSAGGSGPTEGVCSGHDAPVTGPIADPVVHTQTDGLTVTQLAGANGVDIPITINYDLQPTDYVFVLFNARNNTRMTLRNGATDITKIYDRSMGNSGYQWHQAFGLSGLSGQPTLTANACWSTSCPYAGSNVSLNTSYIVYVIRGLGASPTFASTFTPYGVQPGNGATVAPAAQTISAGDLAIFSYVYYGNTLPSESDASNPSLSWTTDATAPPAHLGTAIAARHAYASSSTSVLYRNTMPATGTAYHGSVLFTFK
jgi:type IV pilus assembly protein PilE